MSRRLAVLIGLLACTAPAFALDMPQRKAGLWEIRMEFAGRKMPAPVVQQCVDAETDKLMNSSFGGQGACSKQDMQKTGDTITVDSVCKFGDATTTSHAVVSGSFDSAYTVDVTSTRQGGRLLPGVKAGASTRMTIAAKWLGPCAAGQRPGDIIMANGMKMNVRDMPKTHGVPPQR